jgi:hypothetical protein
MRRYGKLKRLELWWQLYRTSPPVWDLENFWPMDFCWTEKGANGGRNLFVCDPAAPSSALNIFVYHVDVQCYKDNILICES